MTVSAASGRVYNKVQRSSLRLYAVYGLGLLFLAFIFLYRLDANPAPWHDEATFMKVARNYVENGVYANYSSEGDRYTGPTLSLGPTVILPVAAVYKLFGVSITGARLVIIVYAALTLLALYHVSRGLLDQRFALAVLVLAVVTRGNSMPLLWRNVMGEGPALFFVLGGLWLWLRPGRLALTILALVGISMGLACITKTQYAFFVLPTLLLSWFADMVWYKTRGWRHFIVPGVIAGMIFFGWTYYTYFLLGADARDISADFETISAARGNGYFLIDADLIGSNLNVITGADVYAGLLIPAVLLGILLSLRRTPEGQQWSIITLLTALSMAFYIFSIGWLKVGFPSFFLGAILVGRLLYALTGGFDMRPIKDALAGKWTLPALISVLVIGLSVRLIFIPLADMTLEVIQDGSADYKLAAQYIEDNIPENVLIETWEEELAIVTNHTYHFPSQIMEAAIVAEVFRGGPPASAQYDFRDHVDADYVIVGTYAKQVDFYSAASLQDYVLIASIGTYDIYERRQDQ